MSSHTDSADLLVIIVSVVWFDQNRWGTHRTATLSVWLRLPSVFRHQLDLNPFAWAEFEAEGSDQSIDLVSALESLLVFANAHLAIKHENALAVYGATIGRRFGHQALQNKLELLGQWLIGFFFYLFSQLLYSSVDNTRGQVSTSNSASRRDASTYQTFRVVDDAVSEGVKQLMDLEDHELSSGRE